MFFSHHFFSLNITIKIFHVSFAVANIESLKYYLQFLNKYVFRKLVKFEQNQMIPITQNLELFDRKLFSMLTFLHVVVAIL